MQCVRCNKKIEDEDIEDVKTQVESVFGEQDKLTEDRTIELYALIFNKYTITYLDEDEAVYTTENLIFKEDGKVFEDYEIYKDYTPKKQNANFEWWKNEEAHKTYDKDNKTENVSSDITLKAYVPEWYWLVFDENGKWGTYNAPRFYRNGDKTDISPNRKEISSACKDFIKAYINCQCKWRQN